MAHPDRGAWIGFWGNIAGALIAVLAALIALQPAYRQASEAGRASAVQSGEILRKRLAIAQREYAILSLNTYPDQIAAALQLDSEDLDRATWLRRHPGAAAKLRELFIPRLDEVTAALFQAQAGVDLPGLDRSSYTDAILALRLRLHSILDGLERQSNGTVRGPMSAPRWRYYVAETANFARKDVARSHLYYNNNINLAVQLLRSQIVETDRVALGPGLYEQLGRLQQRAREDVDLASKPERPR